MAKEKRLNPLSEVAQKVLDVVLAADAPMTLAEIKKTVPEANAAHLVALRNRGFVGSELTEIEQMKLVKSKVNVYFSTK